MARDVCGGRVGKSVLREFEHGDVYASPVSGHHRGLTGRALFLHPARREFVGRDFYGPARVIGYAGTGKAVVALHRAARLAQNEESKVLLSAICCTLLSRVRGISFGCLALAQFQNSLLTFWTTQKTK